MNVATSSLPNPSKIFGFETANLSGGPELILRGGRKNFPLLPQAFEGVEVIGFIGWGSQAPAQACNLRDSLRAAGSDTVVKVGLQSGSKSCEHAREAGFKEEDGTLMEMHDLIRTADFVIVLISDGAMTELWSTIMGEMRSGATLGVSHGFLLAYLETIGEQFRRDINVVLMAPKGMGKSVRRLFLQGENTEGAGINSSVAIQQVAEGGNAERVTDLVLGWAVGTGSPATFFTTMINEVRSDLYGERSMLLGALWGLVEVLYQLFLKKSLSERDAFLHAVKGLTGIVSRLMSEKGLAGVYQEFADRQYGRQFRAAYDRSYGSMRSVMVNIYDEIVSGREITAVVEATNVLKHTPMSNVEASPMWEVGKGMYGSEEVELDEHLAYAAGAMVAGIMAQMDVLRERGHKISEIVNESFIEIIDSLIPFMDKSGVRRMVDGCSITARLGTRKWGPVFMEALTEAFQSPKPAGPSAFDMFLEDPIHTDIETLFKYRPSVKIAVEPE